MAKKAARDYKARRGGSSSFSGWLGLACGLAIGLGVAGVVYIKDHRPDAAAAHNGKPERKRVHGEIPDTDGAEAGAADPAKTYGFYDRLPKLEVVVPEKDKDLKPDTKTVPETRRGTYVLQAGSYKTFADADRVRAHLALQGVESKVQQVTMESGTWNRIRIGPVSKLDELNRIRQVLRKANIDAQVTRVGD